MCLGVGSLRICFGREGDRSMNSRPSMPTNFNPILHVVLIDLVQQLKHENVYRSIKSAADKAGFKRSLACSLNYMPRSHGNFK